MLETILLVGVVWWGLYHLFKEKTCVVCTGEVQEGKDVCYWCETAPALDVKQSQVGVDWINRRKK